MNASAIENYVPLPQAAKRLKITATALQRLIDNGILHAVRLGGTVAVPESELNQTIFREQFDHLRGQAITDCRKRSKSTALTIDTIRSWIDVDISRYLKMDTGPDWIMADVAYCAAVYQSLGGGRKASEFLMNDGQPYQLKRTDWAEYQRERRKKKKTGPLA